MKIRELSEQSPLKKQSLVRKQNSDPYAIDNSMPSGFSPGSAKDWEDRMAAARKRGEQDAAKVPGYVKDIASVLPGVGTAIDAADIAGGDREAAYYAALGLVPFGKIS